MTDSQSSTAPTVTDELIDSKIGNVVAMQIPGTTVTVAVITLENGYNLVGHSACVSPANFDAEMGRQIAYRNAREQAWALEGYLLREQLYREEQVASAALDFAEAHEDLEYALSRRIK